MDVSLSISAIFYSLAFLPFRCVWARIQNESSLNQVKSKIGKSQDIMLKKYIKTVKVPKSIGNVLMTKSKRYVAR